MCARFEANQEFLDMFYFKSPIPNFMEIHPVGAELFHAEGRTESETDGRN